MKKITITFIILMFIITLFCNIPVYADSYGRIISFDNNKIMVYEQLDYIRLTSSKGHLLAALGGITELDTVTKTTQIYEEIEVPVEEHHTTVIEEGSDIDICFILDESGSMASPPSISRLGVSCMDVLINAVQDFIYKIKDSYGEDSIARVGAVGFSTMSDLLFNLTECNDENIGFMIDNINSLSPISQTYTYRAIKDTNNYVWADDDRDTIKCTILITDGFANDYPELINEAIHETRANTDKFITVFIDESSECVLDDYSASDELFYCNSSALYNTILTDVFEVINDENYTEHNTHIIETTVEETYVDADSLVTDVLYSYNIKMGDTNNYFAEIDDELINGAILEMEYSFNIKSTEEIEEIYIIDYLDRIGFDRDGKMISNPNVTNADYNWGEDGSGNVITMLVPIMHRDEEGNYNNIQVKLILNKVIAIGSDISAQDNHADIAIKTKDNTYYTVDAVDDGTTSALGQVIRIEDQILPPTLTITPTMGRENRSNTYIILIIVLVIIVVIALILRKNIAKKYK